MKKVLLLVAVVATLGFFCNNAQVQAEKARQDSLIEAASRLDSTCKSSGDSIQAAIEAAEAAAVAAADSCRSC